MGRPLIDPILIEHGLLFVTGKGGVGKTTIAAALAVHAAAAGKSVLVCEVDAKGTLAAAFEAGPLRFQPRRVHPGIDAMAMDTEDSLREYLRLYVRLPLVARIGPLARTFDFVADAAPGVRDFRIATPQGISTVGQLVIVRDRAWLEIIRRVQKRENDLVVVARRNQLDAGAIGGIARKLMRKCPCPVWVVNLEGSLEPRAIVAATDFSEVGNLSVVLAADLARIGGGELHVVHAWQAPIVVPIASEIEAPPLAPAELEELQKTVEERLEAALLPLDLPVAVRRHVPCEAPSRAIRDLVERIPADLLVMGTVSRAGIAGLLMGNTAERLLDRVHCSMLTVKPSDFVSPVK